MIRPLSLLPIENSVKNTFDYFSPLRQRADSLVFSVTSQKGFSPKDSLLIVSNNNLGVSKQLETLQLKLQNLQSKVQSIDSQSFIVHGQNSSIHPYHSFLKTQKIYSDNNKQNRDLNATAVGKIVTKNNRLSKSARFNSTKNQNNNRSHVFDMQNRSNITTQQSVMIKKIKEIEKLNKKIKNMKSSVEKSQKSISICTQRLSASKKQIKNLRKESLKKQRVIQKLRNELKRSETIRQKQKQVIMRQQEQLKQFKLIFAAYQRCK